MDQQGIGGPGVECGGDGDFGEALAIELPDLVGSRKKFMRIATQQVALPGQLDT
jgi:hypothetical protein